VTFTLLSLPADLRHYVSEYWYDPKIELVTIRLTEDFEGGSDFDGYTAARLFHSICKQGYLLKVLPYKIGGWVPSEVNPMRREWTQKLIEQ